MSKKTVKNYRCPVSGCSGWVVLVSNSEERDFWGCGECGSIWYDQCKFFDEIKIAVDNFSYRHSCYLFEDGKVFPNELSVETKNYGEKVAKELPEKVRSFIRG